MASATLNDAIEKVHDTAANVAADIKPRVDDLKSDLVRLQREIVSAVGNAYDASKRGAQRAMKGAGKVYDQARDYTADGVRTAAQPPVPIPSPRSQSPRALACWSARS
jgi:hypothetical protein